MMVNRRGSSWWQAVVLSCCGHLLLLAVVGWLSAALFPVPEPAVMEIELVTQPAAVMPTTGVPQADRPFVQQTGASQPATAAQAAGSGSSELPAAGVTTDAGTAADAGSDGTFAAASGAGERVQAAAAATASFSGTAAPAAAKAKHTLPPSILSRVDPVYPGKARREGIEGVVRLRIEITENGRPGSITIAASSGSELLDEAAIEAVRRWKFVPARDADTGEPLRAVTTLPVAFELK